jgi:hypothetical protein
VRSQLHRRGRSDFSGLLLRASDNPCRFAHRFAGTVPQGKDPPRTDEGKQTAPPAEYKGVISPPPVGDEDIYTKVPNPEAGHEKEVIPAPGSPGGDPNVEPR